MDNEMMDLGILAVRRSSSNLWSVYLRGAWVEYNTAPGFACVVSGPVATPRVTECRHCGFVGEGHFHSIAPTIDAEFIAKYPRALED